MAACRLQQRVNLHVVRSVLAVISWESGRPVTGVTLPLVSMGGSSFIFTCCSIGLILSVARNVEQMEGKAPLETEIEIPNETDTANNELEPAK